RIRCMGTAGDLTSPRPEQGAGYRRFRGRARRHESTHRATMIEAPPFAVFVAPLRRRPIELISGGLEMLLNFGLSLHALRHVSKLVDCHIGPRAVEDQAAAIRSLLAHETNRF